MKIYGLLILSALIITGCSSHSDSKTPLLRLEITEVNSNKLTAITKQNLLQLAQVYDLTPFLFSTRINVQTGVTSSSHPVLTLNTMNAEYPKKLLSNLLHQELHWWAVRHKGMFDLAIKDLKRIYPAALFAKDKSSDSNYLELLICFIEARALSFYLGEKEARKNVSLIMKKDKIHSWVYYQVLYKDFAIKKIVEKYKLLPPPLS